MVGGKEEGPDKEAMECPGENDESSGTRTGSLVEGLKGKNVFRHGNPSHLWTTDICQSPEQCGGPMRQWGM